MSTQQVDAPRDTCTVAGAMISTPKLCDPLASVADVRRLFLDSHVHAALITRRGRLLAVVERGDLDPRLPDGARAVVIGRLDGRTVSRSEPLAAAHRRMRENGQRRLAVVDPDGDLVGLLCLKRALVGFCSEADVRARDEERRSSATR